MKKIFIFLAILILLFGQSAMGQGRLGNKFVYATNDTIWIKGFGYIVGIDSLHVADLYAVLLQVDSLHATELTADSVTINEYYYQIEIGIVDSATAWVADNDTIRIDASRSKYFIEIKDEGTQAFWVDTSGGVYTLQTVTIGDTTTGDHDAILYFADDGSFTAESFKWDDGNSRFELSNNFYVDGDLEANGNATADTVLSDYFSDADDTTRVGDVMKGKGGSIGFKGSIEPVDDGSHDSAHPDKRWQVVYSKRFMVTDDSKADSSYWYDDGDTTRIVSDNPIKVGNQSLIIKTDGKVQATGDFSAKSYETNVSATELGYLSSVTSDVQTQIDSKVNKVDSTSHAVNHYMTRSAGTDTASNHWTEINKKVNIADSTSHATGHVATRSALTDSASALRTALSGVNTYWSQDDTATYVAESSEEVEFRKDGLNHGMTGLSSSDAYANFSINDGSDGGLRLIGLTKAADVEGLWLAGASTQATPTDYVMKFSAGEKTATTWSPFGAGKKLFGWYNDTQLRMSLSSSGNLALTLYGSANGISVDGNKTTGNLAEFINDDDGVAGDSSSVVNKLGQWVSGVPVGTSPFSITSTTVNTNLNADLLDGEEATAFQDAHAALASIAGLTEADVSILETTADNTYGVVTSGGNNYILGSNSDNSALEFKTPANVLTQIGGQGLDANLTSLAGQSHAVGDLLYATAAETYGKLADVAAGQPLLSGGVTTAPAYAGYTFSGTAAQTYTFPTSTASLAPLNSPLFTTQIAIGDAVINEAELEVIDDLSTTRTQLNYLSNATGTTGTVSTNIVFSTAPDFIGPVDINTSGSALGLKIDGNKTTGNLFQAINDDDGNPGDSSVVVTAKGWLGVCTANPDYPFQVIGAEVGFDQTVKHNGDPDTYFAFANDRFYLKTGDVLMFDMLENDSQDYFEINGNGGDVDFRVQSANEDSALIVNASDGDVFMQGLDTGTGQTLYRVANTDEIVEDASSRIYKNNIKGWKLDPIKINMLCPVEFDWNEKSAVAGMHDYGLVAEDVARVLPELITAYDSEGNPKDWHQKRMITYLIGVIQDQQKRIEALEEKIK